MRKAPVVLSMVSVLSVALILLACGSDAPKMMDPTPRYDAETLKMKGDLVMSLIKDLSCTDDSQCSSFAYGVKACGGPAQYVVYSTAHVDGQALSDAVADFNAYDAGWIAQESVLSDCMLTPAASPGCVQSQCLDRNNIH
jgi:hypothetical protein